MTAIDTNVLVSLWDRDDFFNRNAQAALDDALSVGPLIVCGLVYAELLAGRSRRARAFDEFFRDAEIDVDWHVSEKVWRLAGEAAHLHGIRRRASGGGEGRRIIADFVIGAHAVVNGHSLLTLDRAFFVRNFPELRVKSFQ